MVLLNLGYLKTVARDVSISKRKMYLREVCWKNVRWIQQYRIK